MAVSHDVMSSFLQILEDVPCARSVTVSMMLRYGEYSQLVNLTTDPVDYPDASTYWRAAQATDLCRKIRDLPTGIDPKAKAVESFYASERRCLETNTRLSKYLHNGPFDPKEMRIADFFDDVKRLVKRVLGPVPELPDGLFGPGSTYGDKGSYNTLPDKLSNSPQFTPNAWVVLSSYAATLWRRGERPIPDFPFSAGFVGGVGPDPVCVPGNRFTTVAKNAKTDRGIAVEPSLNVYYQLSVGKHIRRRLLPHGIDLRYGQPTHRELAREGSIDGSLATIDLSSASDSLASGLVNLLLPPDWRDMVNGLRSPTTSIEGRTKYLEKFSSMGSGFTFELETLLFWALSRKVLDWNGYVDSSLWCYGDDLIVPSKASREVMAVLRYAGFEVNTSKTHTTGPFRESCGGDYFEGRCVNTATIEALPSTPEEWIVLLNNLYRVDPGGWYFRKSRQRILNLLPLHIRACKGPVALGDIVIHSDTGWTTKTKKGKPWIRYVRTWSPVPAKRKLTYWSSKRVQYGAYLSGIPGSGFSPRGWITGHKLKWVPFS